MRGIRLIALTTFLETLRDKVLYGLVLCAMGLIAASILLGMLTIAEQGKIITDMGLASMNAIGVVSGIFVGIGLVRKEIERRTIYTILARPVTRTQFVLGKYAGLVLTLLVNVVILLAVFLTVLRGNSAPIHVGLFQATELLFVELLMVTALALLFSTFSSPMLSATMAGGVYAIGHVTSDLRALAEQSGGEAVRLLVGVLYYVCPNFEVLNIKGHASAGVAVPLSYQLLATGYGLLYTAALLAAACIIVQRRDF